MKFKHNISGKYKLSIGENRQFNALLNHATYGAFRHAPQDVVKGIGTQDKQQWETLGNITKAEAMKRYVQKAAPIKNAIEPNDDGDYFPCPSFATI